jgi:hypothetical protein
VLRDIRPVRGVTPYADVYLVPLNNGSSFRTCAKSTAVAFETQLGICALSAFSIDITRISIQSSFRYRLRNLRRTHSPRVDKENRETLMRIVPLLAASVVAIGLTASGGPSQAAPLSPLQQLQTNQSMAQPAGFVRHCVRWRHICARRWGWGGPRFRRCMIRHGC